MANESPVLLEVGTFLEEGVPIINEGIKKAHAAMQPITAERMGDRSVTASKIKNPVVRIMHRDTVEVNFQTMKLKLTSQPAFVYVDGSPFDFRSSNENIQIDLTPLNLTSPTNYNTYLIYIDKNDNNKIKVEIAQNVTTNALVLGYIYQTKVFGNEEGIKVIDRNGTLVSQLKTNIVDGMIPQSYMKNPVVRIMHAGNVEFNYQTRLITLSQDLYIYNESAHVLLVTKSQFTPIDISMFPLNSADYNSYVLYFDVNEKKVKFDKIQNVKSQAYILTRVYQSSVKDNDAGIKVVDSNGNTVIRTPITPPISDGMDIAYLYTKDKINLDTSNKNVVIEADQHIVSTNQSSYAKVGTTPYTDTQPSSYVRKLYVDKSTGELFVTMHDGKVTKNASLIIGWWGSGAGAQTFGPFNNRERIKIDGYSWSQRSESNGGNGSVFDWSTNKYVLPDELYLLKGIDYNIEATNFNFNKFTDQDNLLFEMVTPTKTQVFENSVMINSPIPIDVKTQIAGIYNNDPTNALVKDIVLHFVDPSTKVNKSFKILCIGDSLTHANIPYLIKMLLQQFGFTPTMIGTVNNGHNDYDYGVVGGVPQEKGEGRGGWRLTDFTGTTKRTDGSTYIYPGNPFWNPSANGGVGGFDFSYYMNNNGFTGVDFVIIGLLANDITGFHNHKVAQSIGTPTIEEILTYMPGEFQKMIDSIHAYDSNIKIGINPPIPAGVWDDFNRKATRCTELQQYTFKSQKNVYTLGNYLANGKLSAKNWGSATKTPVGGNNNTFRASLSNDVHDNGMGQLTNALWSASWIINMSN